MRQHLRLVLAPDVSDEDVSRLAGREDWLLQRIDPGDEESPFEKVWITGDERSSIHYLLDPMHDIPYLTVRGERETELLQAIRDGLPVLEGEQLAKGFDAADGKWDKVDALYRIGLGAPLTKDDALLQRLDQGFRDEEFDVRVAAALASFFAGWPELRERLERLREDDNEEVREAAEGALEDLDALLS